VKTALLSVIVTLGVLVLLSKLAGWIITAGLRLP
jgi:hypothetical protein